MAAFDATETDTDDTADEATGESRGPGRPAGGPKFGGRKKGSRNRRTVLGADYLKSLNPKAKKRLASLLEGKDDGLAYKAAELVLAYSYGRPAQTQLLGGDGGDPIMMQQAMAALDDPVEMNRRLETLMLDMLEGRNAEAVNGKAYDAGAVESFRDSFRAPAGALNGSGGYDKANGASASPEPRSYKGPPLTRSGRLPYLTGQPIPSASS